MRRLLLIAAATLLLGAAPALSQTVSPGMGTTSPLGGATRPVESGVRHLWDERVSGGQIILGIVTSDEQACSNFRVFSYRIGNAISGSRAHLHVACSAPIGLRSGLPPLNRPARKSRPALLPGPAALLATTRRAGGCAQPDTAAAIRRLVALTSLAADKRYIRFFGHYPPSPGAPLSETPRRIWPPASSLRLAPPVARFNRRPRRRGRSEAS